MIRAILAAACALVLLTGPPPTDEQPASLRAAWKLRPAAATAAKELDYPTDPALSAVASVFAGRAVTIQCPTLEQWALDPLSQIAWGYTRLDWSHAVLDPELCRAAHDLAPSSTAPAYPLAADYYRAVAVHVLVHESLHLRRSWSARGHEDKVNCMAIRRFRRGADLLGAEPTVRERIRPWALYEWWRIARLVPEYYLERCAVPGP